MHSITRSGGVLSYLGYKVMCGPKGYCGGIDFGERERERTAVDEEIKFLYDLTYLIQSDHVSPGKKMKEVVIDSYKKRWAIKLKLKMFLLKTKTGISNTGKQIHANLKGNHALGRTIQETDLKYLYEQKL